MPPNTIYILVGLPDYDDSIWIDSIHSSIESVADRLAQDLTPTGRPRSGQKALFPHGSDVEVWRRDYAGGWWEVTDETSIQQKLGRLDELVQAAHDDTRVRKARGDK